MTSISRLALARIRGIRGFREAWPSSSKLSGKRSEIPHCRTNVGQRPTLSRGQQRGGGSPLVDHTRGLLALVFIAHTRGRRSGQSHAKFNLQHQQVFECRAEQSTACVKQPGTRCGVQIEERSCLHQGGPVLVNWTGHINNRSSSDMSAATLIRRRISGQSIYACTFEARESVQGERRCGRSPRGVALSRWGVGETAISSREQRGRGVPPRCAITAALGHR